MENKKPEWFQGIFTALVTPFAPDGSFDETAYRSLIGFVRPHIDGLVPAGTTGEFAYLTTAEKKRAIEVALEEAGGELPVVAGTGCPSTRETVELTRFAMDAGARGALVLRTISSRPITRSMSTLRPLARWAYPSSCTTSRNAPAHIFSGGHRRASHTWTTS
jgi:4-hydroxy-tetrahydrodipicolinate synthase